MQLEAGIDKFKCSTLSEAELLGDAGQEKLLAMQPTRVHLELMLKLDKTIPGRDFQPWLTMKNLCLASARTPRLQVEK